MKSSSSARADLLYSAACCLVRAWLMSLAVGMEYFLLYNSYSSVGDSGRVVLMLKEPSLREILMGGRRR